MAKKDKQIIIWVIIAIVAILILSGNIDLSNLFSITPSSSSSIGASVGSGA